MATLSQSECRRLYSWWWDSHNSPKNSKWLQENLTDIDTKVKSMIKLIEEEADSFARRAEMYYKKRPELMKLVEEFYRAYRALAERYDHAMGELRHAQKTMPEAFPNSAHYILNDDSPCSSLGPEAQSPGPGFSRPVHRSKNNERSSEESDGEVQTLRETMSKMQYDKDALFVQYQKSLEKLSKMESDLNKAQDDAEGLDERASKAEIEVEILKESLKQLKEEKDAGEIQYNQCLASIARLETMLSLAQLEAKGFDDRAARAEIEAKNLKQELTRMEAQKDTVFLPYKLCLEKIPMLEGKITLAEENSRMLNEQIERAELEVKALRKKLTELNEEKESLAFLYNECLKKISSMENEILHAQENAEQLKKSNQNLQLEAENLVQKIALKDQEVLEKHTEIERLKTLMHGEHSHFIQIESALQTLQKLYSQSQQEQRNLSLELKYGLLTLKDLELTKQDFKEEMREIVEENKTLHELNFSSTRSLKKQQMEISKLKEIKEKLEREFSVNAEESNALQLETHQIKDDIQYLNERYQAMLEQLQSLGLNPNSLAGSVKKLQDENSMLKEACQMEQGEKEALREKSKDMDEILIENAFIEFSLLRQNDELDGLRGTVREIQQLCQVLREEKSILVDEKTALLSQLQVMTESMQKLMEKNSLLEESLSDAKIEFEGLRTKSDDLEECCKLLNDEKNNLINERSMLISQLKMVEAKLSNLEKKVTNLEEKYANVEKEKESAGNQVEELRLSILAQKEKHSNHKHSSEARLANLENLVRVLQEEQLLGKVEFEQELDKAVNAQIEMFILQNCIEELELKNLFLLTECEKLVEMSKFSDKIIMELESENLVQLIEEEFLLHRIRKFKMDIHKVCGVLQIDSGGGCDSGIKQEEIPISRILEKIEGFESSLVKSEEENQHLLVENSVLLASLQQHQSVGEKLKSEKKIMEQEFEDMREQNAILQKDKVELLEENRQLRIKVVNGEEKENRSKSTLVALHAEMTDLRRTNQVYQEESGKMLEEKNSLLKSVLDLKDAMSSAEDGNNVMFHEVLALSNVNLVYESFLTEKAVEQQVLREHLGNLSHLNNDLNQELGVLRKNLKLKEAENVFLNESTERMDKELMEMEKRLKAAETLNAEFPRHIEELKMEQEDSRLIKENLDNQILELSENCMNHKKEIEHLNDANESLQSELESLFHEVEKHRVREETLSLELLNKSNEFKLWENEATAFYYDLQMSSICGTLLESKVTEHKHSLDSTFYHLTALMGFTHLSLLALFCLVFLGINGYKSEEEYLKSIWPDTPIPRPLLDLLQPDSKTSVPIRDHEKNQYWTVFFEHDLYPGKKLSLGIHKHSKTHMSVENTNQPFGINTWWDKKSSQAFETHIPTNKAIEEEIRKPIETFGILIWTGKPSQDSESRTEIDKIKEDIEKPDQHFATRKWIDKANAKKTERLIQTSTVPLWTEEEMRTFHDYCGNPSPIGEDKYCAPSLESMMNYVISKLGKNIKAMSSSFSQSQDEYVVEEVKKIGDKTVMCHRLNFKKVAFYCHQINATTTYMVPLVASDGTKSNALTICHHDTRGMDPDILYQILQIKSGTVPVCHFIGNKAIAWVPNEDVTASNDHSCVI